MIAASVIHSFHLFAAQSDNPLPGFMPFQNNYWLWKCVGYGGMALFFSRFFVQWLYSEKHKESKVPVIFWWQSLAGAFLMLLYSLRQQDSVYIMGYLFTVIPYTRNLILVYRKKRQDQVEQTNVAVQKDPAPPVGAMPAMSR